MLASEVAPLAKTGGLADVMEGLPKALAEAHTVAVFLPYYGWYMIEFSFVNSFFMNFEYPQLAKGVFALVS